MVRDRRSAHQSSICAPQVQIHLVGPFDEALGRVGVKTAGKAIERLVLVTPIYPTFIDATSAE
jgi:hypothetical protein